MKKTCKNCYYGASGHRANGRAMINCKMLNKTTRANKDRQGCHYWRIALDGPESCELYGGIWGGIEDDQRRTFTDRQANPV